MSSDALMEVVEELEAKHKQKRSSIFSILKVFVDKGEQQVVIDDKEYVV